MKKITLFLIGFFTFSFGYSQKMEFDFLQSSLDEGELKIPVLWREALVQGEEYKGPLLITENQTTTVVPKNSSVNITQQGLLRITLELES